MCKEVSKGNAGTSCHPLLPNPQATRGKGNTFNSQMGVSSGTLLRSLRPSVTAGGLPTPTTSPFQPSSHLSTFLVLLYFISFLSLTPPLFFASQGASVTMAAVTPDLRVEGVFWTAGSRAGQV